MRTCIDQRRIKKKSVSFSQLQSFLMFPFLITKNTRTMFLLLLKTFELLLLLLLHILLFLAQRLSWYPNNLPADILIEALLQNKGFQWNYFFTVLTLVFHFILWMWNGSFVLYILIKREFYKHYCNSHRNYVKLYFSLVCVENTFM